MADARDQKPRKRSSLIGRLFKLVLFLGIATGLGLVAGFKYGSPVTYQRDGQLVEVKTGQWAWEDVDGFKSYACYWANTSRDTAKQIDQQYGVSDKVGRAANTAMEKGGEVVDKVADKAREQLSKGDAGAAEGPSEADRTAKEREDNFGYSQKKIDKLPAGYMDELRAGHEAMRAGTQAYQRWALDLADNKDNDWQRKSAIERLEAARTHFEKARELYPEDARPEGELKQIQERLHQLKKDSAAPRDY